MKIMLVNTSKALTTVPEHNIVLYCSYGDDDMKIMINILRFLRFLHKFFYPFHCGKSEK